MEIGDTEVKVKVARGGWSKGRMDGCGENSTLEMAFMQLIFSTCIKLFSYF